MPRLARPLVSLLAALVGVTLVVPLSAAPAAAAPVILVEDIEILPASPVVGAPMEVVVTASVDGEPLTRGMAVASLLGLSTEPALFDGQGQARMSGLVPPRAGRLLLEIHVLPLGSDPYEDARAQQWVDVEKAPADLAATPAPPSRVEVGDSWAFDVSVVGVQTLNVEAGPDEFCRLETQSHPIFRLDFRAQGVCELRLSATAADYDYADRTYRIAVGQLPTATRLELEDTTPVVGDTVRATATVTAGGAPVTSGSVQFEVDDIAVGSPVPVVDGTASADLPAGAAGAHVVTARYGGGLDYTDSSDDAVVETMRRAQVLVWATGLPGRVAVGEEVTLEAVGAGPDAPVVYRLAEESAEGVCRLVGATVTAVRPGRCVVAAGRAGSADYAPAEEITTSATVPVVVPRVDLEVADVVYGVDPVAQVSVDSVLGTPDGRVTVSSGTWSRSVDLVDGRAEVGVPGLGAGDHEVRVDFTPADPATFDEATGSGQVRVARADQVLVWATGLPGRVAVGEEVTLEAVGAGPDAPVVYRLAEESAEGVCRLVGATVTAVRPGRCVVAAGRAGSADYAPAEEITTSATVPVVVPRVDLEVADVVYGVDPVAQVSVDSVLGTPDGRVTVSSGTWSRSVDLVDGRVEVALPGLGAGEHEVRAEFVPEDDTTYAAAERTVSATVERAGQSVVLEHPAPASVAVGERWQPGASVASGLPVELSAGPGAVCAVSDGDVVDFTGVGTCVVTAVQSGDADHLAATVVQRIEVVPHPGRLRLELASGDAVAGQRVTFRVVASADGLVHFRLDGESVGSPVETASGLATIQIAVPSAGEHLVEAELDPSTDSVTPARDQVAFVVGRAPTTVRPTVFADRLVAEVEVAAPGAAQVSGEVVFAVDGERVGAAEVVAGRAELPYDARSPRPLVVTASYPGNADLDGAEASIERGVPGLVATLHSRADPRNGWFSAPVRVRFDCTRSGADLVGECPKPVRLADDGTAQVEATLAAVDGGLATVTTTVQIDRTAPVVRVRARRCVARDALSGVDSCRTKRIRPRPGVLRIVAIATDLAGNRARDARRYVIGRSG